MEPKLSKIELNWETREGGKGRTKRDYLDIVIDGESLSKLVGGDLVSCLGWLPGENELAVRRLLLEEPADFPNERRSLYVCPECGDIGCGAVTVAIEKRDNSIIWRDFGFENTVEDTVDTRFNAVGPYVFEPVEYESVLKQAAELEESS